MPLKVKGLQELKTQKMTFFIAHNQCKFQKHLSISTFRLTLRERADFKILISLCSLNIRVFKKNFATCC